MTVCCHILPASRWRRLSPSPCGVTRLASGETHRVVALVARCRGHDGFGHAASGDGIAALAAASDEREAVTLVVEEGCATLGAIGLVGATTPNGTRWSIPCLLVDPTARGRGLGSALVREALREAETRGASMVAAETSSAWKAADAFWRAIAGQLAD